MSLDKKALGRLLKKRRKELKTSLVELAATGSLSASYLSALERGNIDKTKYDKILKISKAYRVPLENVKSAFKASAKEAEEMAHIDIILKQIAADEKLKLRDLLQDVLEDGDLGKNTKMLIIRLYENIYHKKLL